MLTSALCNETLLAIQAAQICDPAVVDLDRPWRRHMSKNVLPIIGGHIEDGTEISTTSDAIRQWRWCKSASHRPVVIHDCVVEVANDSQSTTPIIATARGWRIPVRAPVDRQQRAVAMCGDSRQSHADQHQPHHRTVGEGSRGRQVSTKRLGHQRRARVHQRRARPCISLSSILYMPRPGPRADMRQQRWRLSSRPASLTTLQHCTCGTTCRCRTTPRWHAHSSLHNESVRLHYRLDHKILSRSDPLASCRHRLFTPRSAVWGRPAWPQRHL